MKNIQIKNTGQLAVILILSVLVGFMIFSFGMELGREYYHFTHR